MKTRRITLVILAVAAAALAAAGLFSATATAVAQDEDAALEEFIPSEELPADGAVAFPVDI